MSQQKKLISIFLAVVLFAQLTSFTTVAASQTMQSKEVITQQIDSIANKINTEKNQISAYTSLNDKFVFFLSFRSDTVNGIVSNFNNACERTLYNIDSTRYYLTRDLNLANTYYNKVLLCNDAVNTNYDDFMAIYSEAYNSAGTTLVAYKDYSIDLLQIGTLIGTATGLVPKESDKIVSALDYCLDYVATKSTLGTDEANKKIVKKVIIDAIYAQFSDFISSNVGKVIGQKGFYEWLTNDISSPSLKEAAIRLAYGAGLKLSENTIKLAIEIDLAQLKETVNTVFNSSEYSPKYDTSNYNVIVDGNLLSLDVQPTIINGRVLVPIRFIAEALGGDVTWDSTTNTVRIVKDSIVIEMQIDNIIARVNGQDVNLDVPATIIGTRTMVPIRFVSSSMDTFVDWNEDTKTVIVTSKNNTVSQNKGNEPGIPTLYSPSSGTSIKVGQTVTLSWSNTGAAKYRLEVINDSGTGTFGKDVYGTSYSFTPQYAGNWRWQVRSYKSDDSRTDPQTALNLTVTVATEYQPSDKPALLSPSDGSTFKSSSPTLYWSPVNSPSGGQVKYWVETFDNPNHNIEPSYWITGTSWTPTSTTQGLYNWHVKSIDVNTGKESGWGVVWQYNISSGDSDQLADLMPTDITYNNGNLGVNENIILDSGIKNIGNSGTGVFNIKWYINGAQVSESAHQGILANTTDTSGYNMYTWKPTAAGTYTITFQVDCWNVITETNESNNQSSITITIPESPVITSQPITRYPVSVPQDGIEIWFIPQQNCVYNYNFFGDYDYRDNYWSVYNSQPLCIDDGLWRESNPSFVPVTLQVGQKYKLVLYGNYYSTVNTVIEFSAPVLIIS